MSALELRNGFCLFYSLQAILKARLLPPANITIAMSITAASRITTSTIGFPRIGPKREMKKALEDFWAGKLPEDALMSTFHSVNEAAWKAQATAGIDLVALDGTLYDHVADFAVTYLGLVPERFSHLTGLDLYFGAARGTTKAVALDMSKLFDTNYHYLAPELTDDSAPSPNWEPLLDRVRRGQAAIGADHAVPILVGPVTLVALSRGLFDRDAMVARLVPAYVDVLKKLKELGVPEVQVVMMTHLLPCHAPLSLALLALHCTTCLHVQSTPSGVGMGIYSFSLETHLDGQGIEVDSCVLLCCTAPCLRSHYCCTLTRHDALG